jgi:UDP-N-acetylmuramoylalanine-D-glutamate ligase
MKKVEEHDHVLFSPAGASFDLFSNYQERGNQFKKLVHDLNS